MAKSTGLFPWLSISPLQVNQTTVFGVYYVCVKQLFKASLVASISLFYDQTS